MNYLDLRPTFALQRSQDSARKGCELRLANRDSTGDGDWVDWMDLKQH